MTEQKTKNAHEVVAFYDAYVPRQIVGGISARHRAIVHAMRRHGCVKAGSHALEIGCGIGTVTALLARQPLAAIHAIDISEASIAVARIRLKRFSHVTFEVSDAKALPEQAYDLVVLPDVIEHIPQEDHPALFTTIDRSLRPGGSVFINIPDPDHLDHTREHHPEALQIIDQSIRFPKMCEALQRTSLDIVALERYSVWTKPYDYRRIVLKKPGAAPVFRKKHPYLIRRIKGVLHRVSILFDR